VVGSCCSSSIKCDNFLGQLIKYKFICSMVLAIDLLLRDPDNSIGNILHIVINFIDGTN
jgi:hypothetical protein